MVPRIVITGILLSLLLACDSSSPTPVEIPPPHFSDCTEMSDRVFVAYESPNLFLKPDTVRLSFTFASIDFDAITCTATMDSGSSWITLDGLLATSDSTASLVWIPRNEAQQFDYCGKKQCVVRLSATTTDTTFETDPFTIIGSGALQLDNPSSGETIRFADTTAIRYITNTDMVSNVQVFFSCDTSDDWFEITGTTSRIDDDSPIRTMQTLFIPSDHSEHIPEGSSQPLLFLLRDYNSPLQSGMMMSGNHQLLRE